METIEGTHAIEPGDTRELLGLIEAHDAALLTTIGPDGHFHTRPMQLQKQALSLHEIWFATNEDTEKVHDLEHDGRCGVSLLSSEQATSYVSLSGRAEVVRDRARVRELWRPDWRAWFPDGPESVVLIRFVPEHAEYVHPKSGRLAVAASMLRNLLGRRTEPAPKKELVLH